MSYTGTPNIYISCLHVLRKGGCFRYGEFDHGLLDAVWYGMEASTILCLLEKRSFRVSITRASGLVNISAEARTSDKSKTAGLHSNTWPMQDVYIFIPSEPGLLLVRTFSSLSFHYRQQR